MCTRVDEKVFSEVLTRLSIVRYSRDKYGMGDDEWYQLSNAEVIVNLQRAVQPERPDQFLRKMNQGVSLKLPSGFILNQNNYLFFHKQLMLYKRDFMAFFDFMAYNTYENVPDITFKKDGLIKCFLSKIPGEYADNVCSTGRLMKIKYTRIEEFINDFFNHVYNDYKDARNASKLADKFKSLKKDSTSDNYNEDRRDSSSVNNNTFSNSKVNSSGTKSNFVRS